MRQENDECRQRGRHQRPGDDTHQHQPAASIPTRTRARKRARFHLERALDHLALSHDALGDLAFEADRAGAPASWLILLANEIHGAAGITHLASEELSAREAVGV